MTYPELQIQLGLNPDNRVNVFGNVDTCRWTEYGYLFVDQEDGQCYLFDEDGNLDDIRKIKSIEYSTFADCKSLTRIQIPDSVKSIGDRAFAYCESLTNIEIPDLVKSIGRVAFVDCTSLKSISIPNSVKRIGLRAFEDCTSLTSISIPDSVKNVGYNAFAYCTSLKSIIFKRKTIDQVKAMNEYPWGIRDKSVIKVES